MQKVRNFVFGLTMTAQLWGKEQDLVGTPPPVFEFQNNSTPIAQIYSNTYLQQLNQSYYQVRKYLEILIDEATSGSSTITSLLDVLDNGQDIIEGCYDDEFEGESIASLHLRIQSTQALIEIYEQILEEKLWAKEIERDTQIQNTLDKILNSNTELISQAHACDYIAPQVLQSVLEHNPDSISGDTMQDRDDIQVANTLQLPEDILSRVKNYIARGAEVNIKLAEGILKSIPGVTITYKKYNNQRGRGDHGSILRNGKKINIIDKGKLIGGSSLPMWLFIRYQTRGHQGKNAPFTKSEIYYGIAKYLCYI